MNNYQFGQLGADLGISRGSGGGFAKKIINFVDIFLGRPNQFFQLTLITIKTLI